MNVCINNCNDQSCISVIEILWNTKKNLNIYYTERGNIDSKKTICDWSKLQLFTRMQNNQSNGDTQNNHARVI